MTAAVLQLPTRDPARYLSALTSENLANMVTRARCRATSYADVALIEAADGAVSDDWAAKRPPSAETRELIAKILPICLRAETFPLTRRVKGYEVTRETSASAWRSCSCPARKACKHIQAARLVPENRKVTDANSACDRAIDELLLSHLDDAKSGDLRAALTIHLASVGELLTLRRWGLSVIQFANGLDSVFAACDVDRRLRTKRQQRVLSWIGDWS